MKEAEESTDTASKSRPSDGERHPMWAVRQNRVTLYFLLFTLQVLAGASIVIWQENARASEIGAYEAYIGIIQGIGWVGLASAINAFVITETLEGVMVMATWLRDNLLEPSREKLRDEGREQGREQGRAKAFEEIKEWEARRKDAEARGEPFDELPPYLNSSSSNGHAS